MSRKITSVLLTVTFVFVLTGWTAESPAIPKEAVECKLIGFPEQIELGSGQESKTEVPLKLRIENHTSSPIVFGKREVTICVCDLSGVIISGSGNDHTLAFTKNDFVRVQSNASVEVSYPCVVETDGTKISIHGVISEFFWAAHKLENGKYQIKAEYDLAVVVGKYFREEKDLLDQNDKKNLLIGNLSSSPIISHISRKDLIARRYNALSVSN